MTATAGEREALRESADDVLDAHSSPERVHRLVDEPPVFDEPLWTLMSELGWTGIALPEEIGGVGYGVAEQTILFEALGRHLTGTSLVPTAIASAGVLAAGGEAGRLEPVAAGTRRLAASLAAATEPVTDARPALHAEGGTHRLDGKAGLVWEGAAADQLVLVAGDEEGGLAVVCLARDAAGVAVTPVRPMDRTRQLAMVTLEAAPVPATALLARGADAARIVDRMLDRAALALAVDSLGGGERLLKLTVEYAKQRVQFGRAIGSFQAIKHRCADMLIAVEASRSMVDNAVSALGGADPARGAAMASAAKAYCADAYAVVAGAALQTHGGIGFTWEGDVQLHLKRAKLNQQLCGSSAWHRARAADLLFGPAAAASKLP